MTRVIKSRRAGLSRDQARQQPIYARLLGLQYLTPSGFLCFVFFEGAVALGVLLALAELVSWWGVLVLPITVAVMVKINDVVAGALTHPTAAAARSRESRDVARLSAPVAPSDADGMEVPGSSPALRRAAVRSAAASPAAPLAPAGSYHSGDLYDSGEGDPYHSGDSYSTDAYGPGDQRRSAEPFDPAEFFSDTGPLNSAVPLNSAGPVVSAGRDFAADAAPRGADLPPVGPFTPTGPGPVPAQPVQWWGPQRGQDEPAPQTIDYRSWRPGSWTPDRQFADSRMSATRMRPAMPVVDATTAGTLNEPPAARQWPAAGESLDDPEQWARQTASRRYD